MIINKHAMRNQSENTANNPHASQDHASRLGTYAKAKGFHSHHFLKLLFQNILLRGACSWEKSIFKFLCYSRVCGSLSNMKGGGESHAFLESFLIPLQTFFIQVYIAKLKCINDHAMS